MASRKTIYLILAAVFLGYFGFAGVSNANAQSYSSWDSFQRGIEITPFGGTRFGGTINTENTSNSVDYLTIKTSFDYGVMADVDLWQNLQAEFMWNRQPTVLGAHDSTTGATTSIGDATLDMYQWGLLYEFRSSEKKLRPFIVGGLGFTDYETNSLLPFGDKFAYNIGGGVKYFFAKHVGVRLDVRYSPSRSTSGTAVFFDPFFGPYEAQVNNYARQGQANVGVILRF
jgi:hypothetical protein